MAKQKLPILMLQGRMLERTSEGLIRDVTSDEYIGLNAFARHASDANEILCKCKTLLELLLAATIGKKKVEADQVRVLLDEVLVQLRDGDDLPYYIQQSGKAFKHADPLPPLPIAGHEPNLKLLLR